MLATLQLQIVNCVSGVSLCGLVSKSLPLRVQDHPQDVLRPQRLDSGSTFTSKTIRFKRLLFGTPDSEPPTSESDSWRSFESKLWELCLDHILTDTGPTGRRHTHLVGSFIPAVGHSNPHTDRWSYTRSFAANGGLVGFHDSFPQQPPAKHPRCRPLHRL